jgi:hypothetical protein
MNPEISALHLVYLLFQCVKVAAPIFFPPKKGHQRLLQSHQMPKIVYGLFYLRKCQNQLKKKKNLKLNLAALLLGSVALKLA